jgi:membrane-associated phospholipid phosphatase
MSRRILPALGVIAATLAVARREEPSSLDAGATRVLSADRGAVIDRVAGAATDVGSVFGMTGLAGILAVGGERRLALRTYAAGSIAWAVAQGTKELVDRRRPYEIGSAERLVSVPAGSSWPSGHASVAAAMAATLAPSLTPAGRMGAAGVAAMVAGTRLMVGVHHLTDVAAGAAIGVVAADVARIIERATTQQSRLG